MKRLFITLLSFVAAVTIVQAQSDNGWNIRIMPQMAWGTNNDVQQPNDASGTRFSLPDDIGRKNNATFSPRVEVEYNIKRHHMVATAAWVDEEFEGPASKDIVYDGVAFAQGSMIDAKYKFHTYRLGYRYRIVEHPRFNFELGATLLLRDACISLESGSDEGKFTNVGVAPLLSYSVEWMATQRLSLLSYGDALAVKAGRAEDIFAGMKYRFSPLVYATAGYRLLEGGSDGDRVYTMATFHFFSLGVGFSF
jgi:opacity protein-like surface antigen